MSGQKSKISGIKWFHYCLDDISRWEQLVSCDVDDVEYGRGTVSSIRHRENGNPIVSIEFDLPINFSGDSFAEPEVYVWVNAAHVKEIERSYRLYEEIRDQRQQEGDRQSSRSQILDEKTVERCLRGFGLWHMTHLSNLSSILRTRLLSHCRARSEGIGYHDISDESVQACREGVESVYKRPIHDYVPLYINPRNAMLSKLREIQHEICFIEIDQSIILKKPCVVADGNAASPRTEYFRPVEGLLRLDWNLLRRGSWYDDKEAKRKMCAEVLVPNEIPPTKFVSIRCYNANFLRYIKADNIPKLPSPELYF